MLLHFVVNLFIVSAYYCYYYYYYSYSYYCCCCCFCYHSTVHLIQALVHLEILLIHSDRWWWSCWAQCIYTGSFIIISVIQPPKDQPVIKYSNKFISIYLSVACLQMVVSIPFHAHSYYVLMSWLQGNELVSTTWCLEL